MKKLKIIGEGNPCPKCKKPMERRGHSVRPKNNWYYTKWDFCKNCKHLQHYDEFRSSEWQEKEQQDLFFNSI
jgi:hypothetical protein